MQEPYALGVYYLLTMFFHYVILQKRREKINERLRILQNLVPNGTKVDISTMLEDAVHYVQFLQLQIKVPTFMDNLLHTVFMHIK